MKHALLLTATLLSSITLAGHAAASPLTDLAQAHFDAEAASDPVGATLLGRHEGDDRLDDVSPKALAAQARRVTAERKALQALDLSHAPMREQDDRDVLLAQLGGELLTLQTIQPYRHNPDSYVQLVTNGLYGLIARNYAPPQVRMQAAIDRLRQIPALLAAAPSQLHDVPAIYLEITSEDLKGSLLFIKRDVPEAFAVVHDAALHAAMAQASKTAVLALEHYRMALHAIHPRESFALGRDILCQMLAADMIDTPPKTIIAVGEKQLEKDRAAFLSVARSINPQHPDQALAEVRRDHPTADELIPTAKSQIRGLQDFVTAHHLVTLPTTALPDVVPTPPFEQSLISAATEWPGPFEKTPLPTFYDITLPAKSFTPLQTTEALEDFNRPELLNITIHEVMPGHFVQGLYLHAHPEWSLIRKGASSYTTTEGWAHYSEQMMVEQGADDKSPALHLMQLQDALLRDCRLLSAFGMHMQGMTLRQATDMMEKRCFQSPVAAYKEARRGTSDPGYFSYTLGKLMILKLRQDMQNSQGTAFSLQQFHDAILGAALVPMRVIRRELTGKDGALL